MIKNQRIFRAAGTLLFIFILCVIFVEPLRTRMNNIFTFKERGELKEEEVIGNVTGYNPRVKEAQGILKTAGFYSGPADGFFGGKTRGAIKRFQETKGLEASGRIDQLTFLALNRQKEAAPMHTPEPAQLAAPPQPLPASLKEVQSALSRAGFYKGKIDGIMGAKTKKALKDFQSSKGLKSDGVAGPKTWEELKRHL